MKNFLVKSSMILLIGFISVMTIEISSDGFGISVGQELKAAPADWCEGYKSGSEVVSTQHTTNGPIYTTATCCIYAPNSPASWCNQSKDNAACPERICNETVL